MNLLPPVLVSVVVFLLSIAVASATSEITISGGAELDVSIVDGDTTTATSDLTLFQTIPAGSGSTSRIYRISNPGDEVLTISPPTMGTTIVGAGASAFRFQDTGVGRFETKVAAGAFDDFEIVFEPDEPGVYRATVLFANNSPGDTSTYTFDIEGRATDTDGNIGLNITGLNETQILPGDDSPSIADGTNFGTFTTGGGPSVFRTFTIGNASLRQQLNISGGVVLENGANSNFRVSSSPPSIIGVGQSADFTIQLTRGTVEGPRSATVMLTTDDPLNPIYTFAIGAFVGTRVDPSLTITGDGVDLIFDIDATAGLTYALFTSIDLIDWQPVLSRTGLTSGSFRFEDFISSVEAEPRRFWRIEEE